MVLSGEWTIVDALDITSRGSVAPPRAVLTRFVPRLGRLGTAAAYIRASRTHVVFLILIIYFVLSPEVEEWARATAGTGTLDDAFVGAALRDTRAVHRWPTASDTSQERGHESD